MEIIPQTLSFHEKKVDSILETVLSDHNIIDILEMPIEENDSSQNISTCDIIENVPSCSNRQAEVKECAQHNPVHTSLLRNEETANVSMISMINVFFCVLFLYL